jgi:2-polyprenyl-3-methyl-5-hydroxy-6-metoxy-1,4-benzoquinol methylase
LRKNSNRLFLDFMSTGNIFTNQSDIPFPRVSFEEVYTASRSGENRIYPDEQVTQLPFIAQTHAHYREWSVRRRSSDRLINYLKKKNKSLSILEVGCGNGWLSARLATLRNSTVTGTDINSIELNQASKVFTCMTNLNFEARGVKDFQSFRKFDIVVFAASIQYFASLDRIIPDSLTILNPDGEIHILDSHFYRPEELELARKRSVEYYHSIGFDGMSEFYFHHSFDALKRFKHKIIFNPKSLKNKIFWKNDPFPWIRITFS